MAVDTPPVSDTEGPGSGKGLRRTSSLVLGSPSKSSNPGKRPSRIEYEVVPDSQEETQEKPRTHVTGLEVIELTSGSDDNDDLAASKIIPKKATVDDPFLFLPKKLEKTPSKLSQTIVQETDSESEEESDNQPRYAPKVSKSPWRRAVISDSEDESDAAPRGKTEKKAEPLSEEDDDGAILVFNDPPASRKPAVRDVGSPSKAKPKRPAVAPTSVMHPTPSGGQVMIADPSPLPSPVLPRPRGPPKVQAKVPDFFSLGDKNREKARKKDTTNASIAAPLTSRAPKTTTQTKSPAKRMTKKALLLEKQSSLAAYAQSLFDELNKTVFMSRLPKETPLVWNNRLLATAGRAKWHRDSKGVEKTSIELATKVLDCEERIRNTLSHEMCHLACWVINCNPKENHGRVWQGWVDEVMDKRPDIVISTKHSYDIAYKYEWQCQTASCKKIYGRHSNSIDPAKSICGVCKVGDLAPLFQIRARKNKATSKMAAGKTLDSPLLSTCGMPGAFIESATPSRIKTSKRDTVTIVISSDSDHNHGAVFDEDTDADPEERVTIPKTKGLPRTAVKTNLETEDGGKKSKFLIENGVDGKDLRGLITHMSIIDITDD